ncbi:MAG: DeoR/GlpR family transcriptional regulator, partial [Anaerolineae bacterium]|nr:DeoR/GlpR family transcriptional regulator [Anaerolineae bacterium]
ATRSAQSTSAQARHQKILALLKERPAVGVAELAEALGVSQNTIRNDLDALAEQGLVVRSRGGATVPRVVLPPQLWPEPGGLPGGAEHIVEYAASRVDDGDSLILGDSALCVLLAERIARRRDLRVITTSVAAAYLLVQEPSNRVVLAGGELDRSRLATFGNVAGAAIKDFRARKAFFSCTGVSVQNGLTEADSDGAQLKRIMKQAADLVFVLVESARVGRIDLFPVAELGEVSRIVTDAGLDRAQAQALARAGARVTLCDESGHTTYRGQDAQGRSVRIGFGNLSDGVWFAREVRAGLEQAARRSGRVELLSRDNRMEPEVAIRNAEELLRERIDLLIEYDGTGSAGRTIMRMMRAADVPVIAIDIPIPGATHFGCDHDAAGTTAGQVLGRWVNARWAGHLDDLLLFTCSGGGAANGKVGPANLAPILRFEAALEALRSLVEPLPPARQLVVPGDWALSEQAIATFAPVFAETLRGIPEAHRVGVICLTDEVALGVAQVARQLGRQAQLAVVHFGSDAAALRAELALPDTCLLGAVNLHPERYGEGLVDTALRLLDGEPVPPAVFVEHGFLSREEVAESLRGAEGRRAPG